MHVTNRLCHANSLRHSHASTVSLLSFLRFAEENVGKSWWDQHPVVGFRRLFYLVTPEESSFEHESQVPNYVLESFPYFGGKLLEKKRKKEMIRHLGRHIAFCPDEATGKLEKKLVFVKNVQLRRAVWKINLDLVGLLKDIKHMARGVSGM